MVCPFCKAKDTNVIDSRETSDGIRRRRECAACGQRFTTYERLMANSVVVVKRDGRREEFNRQKLTQGIQMACSKRPEAMAVVEKIVEEIEVEIQKMNKPEVPSRLIGEMVMEKLKPVDQVSYVRFASVYRDFKDLEGFFQAIDTLRHPQEARASRRGGGSVPNGQLALMPAMELISPGSGKGGGKRKRGAIKRSLGRSRAPLKPVPGTR